MNAACLEGSLRAYGGGKAKNVTGACVCAFASGIRGSALDTEGKDGQEPAAGPGQLLPPASNDGDVGTGRGGVGEVSNSRAPPPFSGLKTLCLA